MISFTFHVFGTKNLSIIYTLRNMIDMKRKNLIIYAIICSSFFLTQTAFAHVPYLEYSDFSVQRPFQVKRSNHWVESVTC